MHLSPADLTPRVGGRLDARLQADIDHPLALALSGGGDSMALLEIAADWARRRGRRLLAITVDHGLNPAGPDWSRTCAHAARAAGADWVERRWTGDKPATGLPAAARGARHALVAEAARAAGARVILFAHTADDIAEGDWMKARGSTLGALREWSPSPAWPEGRGLMLLRPLLDEGRAALRDWLTTRGRDWIEDPANADERFSRSRARRSLSLLPVGGGGAQSDPTTGGSRSETDEGRMDDEVARSAPSPFPASDRFAPGRSNPLPLGEGFSADRLIPAGTLAATLLCASGQVIPPRGQRLDHLVARLRSGESFTATLAGARIVADADRILIGRESGEWKRRPTSDLALAPGRPAVWDGRFEITVAAPGWRVTAAAGRLNQLAAADRTLLRAVPAWARAALPVLIRDDGSAPVLAWRVAEVRALAPRRLALALGETTQETDLVHAIHGETPPTDLFSGQDHNNGAAQSPSRDREP